MKTTWQIKIVFSVTILASCAWFLLASAIGVGWFRRLWIGGLAGQGYLEILIVSVLALQPAVILFLIVRAVRLRGVGGPLRIVARAFYPLAPALLLGAEFNAIYYLDSQAASRMAERRHIGAITYACSEWKIIGGTDLRLTEHLHPGRLGTWIVVWPGKKPIEATSFEAHTGSEGGSQVIKWREPNGRPMIAYISFSDLMEKHGPSSILVALVESDAPVNDLNRDTIRSVKNFTCELDP